MLFEEEKVVRFETEEIEKKEFKNTFNGYNKVEVDQFLAKVIVEFKILQRENEDLLKENESNQEKINYYMTLEKTMQNSMEIAQKTLKFSQNQSDKAKVQADKEAEHIVNKAMDQAKAILEHTNEKNELLIKEYNKYCEEFITFKMRVANFIETQRNVFSTSPKDLELSPLDLSSFEEYVLKNIADESHLGKENSEDFHEDVHHEMEYNEDFSDPEDALVKG